MFLQMEFFIVVGFAVSVFLKFVPRPEFIQGFFLDIAVFFYRNLPFL